MVGEGNAQVQDAGWPEGAVAVANLKTRIGWWEGPPFGGGEYHFDYRGKTEDFNQALETFSKIIAPRLELIVHGEPYYGFAGNRNNGAKLAPIDWSFTVWNPEHWHHLYNNPKSFFAADQPHFRKPVDPPRIDVYPGFLVQWESVKVPTNITVLNRRFSASSPNSKRGVVMQVDVYDMATGKAIRAARLVVAKWNQSGRYESMAEQEADARGRIRIDGLAADAIRLSVAAPGYAPRVLGYESAGTNTGLEWQTALAKNSTFNCRVLDDAGHPFGG